jgi:hypothetical protein
MQLSVNAGQGRVEGKHLDFRDEILAQIYDKGELEPKRTLTFDIEVSDDITRLTLGFARLQLSGPFHK